MTKQIPVAQIKALNGRPFRIPKRNEDGEVVFKEQTEEAKAKGYEKELELVEADTQSLLRMLTLMIPRSIQTTNDPLRVSQLWHRLDVPVDGNIQLHDKLYEWLHRLLNRELPLTAIEKEQNMRALPFSQHLWIMNARWIVEQLKEVDERKDLGELEGID